MTKTRTLDHIVTTGQIERKRSRCKQIIKTVDGLAAWLGQSATELVKYTCDHGKWKVTRRLPLQQPTYTAADDGGKCTFMFSRAVESYVTRYRTTSSLSVIYVSQIHEEGVYQQRWPRSLRTLAAKSEDPGREV